jgi:plastocyanin
VLLRIALAVVSLGLAAGACLQGDRDDERSASSSALVAQHDFYFDYNNLAVAVGASIPLVVQNKGDVAHTFTILELGLDEKIEPGEDATVELEADQAGSFRFFCRFHEDRGMVGLLIVAD